MGCASWQRADRGACVWLFWGGGGMSQGVQDRVARCSWPLGLCCPPLCSPALCRVSPHAPPGGCSGLPRQQETAHGLRRAGEGGNRKQREPPPPTPSPCAGGVAAAMPPGRGGLGASAELPHRLRAPHPKLPARDFFLGEGRQPGFSCPGLSTRRSGAAAETLTRLFHVDFWDPVGCPAAPMGEGSRSRFPPWCHPLRLPSPFPLRPTNGLITTRWSASAGTTSRTASTACGTPSPPSKERR